MERILPEISLLNKSNGQSPSELPPPAAQDLPDQSTNTRGDTVGYNTSMKINKAVGLGGTITAETLQNGGEAIVDIIHGF